MAQQAAHLQLPFVLHCCGRRIGWFYVKFEAVDAEDADGFALGDGLSGCGAPEFAVDADQAFGRVLRTADGLDDDAFGADHFFGARHLFPFARTEDEAHEQDGQGGEWQSDGDRCAKADSALEKLFCASA